MRLGIIASHPVQYQVPLFRELARRCDVRVLFAHRATPADHAASGFNVAFDWDIDLTSGFEHSFLENVARHPGLERFWGCDTPHVGAELRQFAPDSILLMGWHLKCYWQSIGAAHRLGVPVMVRGDSQLETPRGILKRAGKAALYPVALRSFDAALYVGERSRRYFEHYKYPKDRQFFSPHCVDNEWFSTRATNEAGSRLRESLGIASGAVVALFAGKLVPFKQPIDLIEAAGQCRADGKIVEVMVAGSGELELEIRRRAAELRVPLHILGFCNQTEMPPAYAAADMLVLPSSVETWGLVVNEALACGRPVIVSDACGCAPDLAADARVGRVFPSGDTRALAREMRSLLGALPSSARIMEQARKFSVSASADGILAAALAVGSSSRCRVET